VHVHVRVRHTSETKTLYIAQHISLGVITVHLATSIHGEGMVLRSVAKSTITMLLCASITNRYGTKRTYMYSTDILHVPDPDIDAPCMCTCRARADPRSSY